MWLERYCWSYLVLCTVLWWFELNGSMHFIFLKVTMKAYLSGMPDCKFCLNDKLVMGKESQDKNKNLRSLRRNVSLDDCTFHRCVCLGKFDADRTITFIPPDGEFELMRYRVTSNINLPFRIIPSVQEGKSCVNVNITIISQIDEKVRKRKCVYYWVVS